MITAHFPNLRHPGDMAAAARSAFSFLRAPARKTDADAILFSAKSFAAAMLAYYVALRIGLPKPYWAILTVYIVSQGSAGASLSRGVYRLAGTIGGAIATVAIVPTFVNSPMACSVVLAGWIGLCLFFSLLDRTPRAYAFVLAGYTTSLIGFPSVADPGAVFDTASLRVQEISLGILCAVLVHRLVLPKHSSGAFLDKLSATLRDARRLARDALDGMPSRASRHDRFQLAADLLALQGLAAHLPYDPAPFTPHAGKLRLIHDRLARLLLLATEIEERIEAVGDENARAELTALLDDVRSWIDMAGAAERDGLALDLIGRARLLQARTSEDKAEPGERLVANLAGRLAEMTGLLYDCDQLARNIATPGRTRDAASLQWPGSAARGYVHHRDPPMAARAALGAALGIILGCGFWIWSAWPDGGLAVSILGVSCALFGNVDTPAPNVRKYLVGSIHGVAISLAYSFVILPRVTDFVVLVAVLAPAFLWAGSLQARPQTTFKALGVTLTIPILAGLGARYGGDFAESLNSVLALFAGIGFSLVSMTLFQTVPVDVAINRLLRLSRRDVRRRALAGGSDEARWTSLMIDRTALLLPRLQLSQRAAPDILDETLHHLSLGHAAGQLRKALRSGEGEIADDASDFLSAIAVRFGTGSWTKPADTVDLEQRADSLMARIQDSAIADRSRLLDLLIDLQLALTPSGAGNSGRGA
ncbi:FUSC family protein [Sphingomonas sp. QA11]|uniref:FUSC family protein n=1 Tax=Sphingomonas sp. QA11 TaxID=2950605 RepID=UPI00234B709C|nr:FUSC family protein [Sphingomonas sp. QA11]WCM28668.1 FUSC family protein [Sphingomonas sp. QA11]